MNTENQAPEGGPALDDEALGYRQANPLGGPAKVFQAMADAIEAGDSYEDTLRRYGYAEAKPAPAEEGDGMLKPLIYAAMMHNGKPKTVAEFERAAATVADMLERRAIAQPLPEALPHPGSPEADKMLDALLAEYGQPVNMKNAARAGYMAARRLLQHARQPLPATDDAEPNVQPKGMPAEWLDAFEEWRQTLGAADLDGKRDLVWRHIAGTGFQAGAAWARSQAPAPAPETSLARPFSAVKSFADSVLAMLDERIKAVDQAAHPFNDYFGDKPETIVAAKAQAGELREVRTQVRILADRALVELMKFRPATQSPAVEAEDDMLEPLIYAAIMHNGTPKTAAEFERAARTVAEMLERRTPASGEWRGLTGEERAAFVNEICDHGTGFVAPLFSLAESLEDVLRARNSASPAAPAQAEADAKDATRYQALRGTLGVNSFTYAPRITDPSNEWLTYTPDGLDKVCDEMAAALAAKKPASRPPVQGTQR